MLHILEAKIDNEEVFSIELEDGISAIFHSMKLSEYTSYTEFINAYPNQKMDAEEFLFKRYVVQFVDKNAGLFYLTDVEEEGLATCDELLDMVPAGVVSSLSWAILSTSAPHTTENLEEHLRMARYTQQQDLVGIILSLIATTYHIDVNTLKKEKTWNEILSMFAQAESVLTGQIPELPLELDKEK